MLPRNAFNQNTHTIDILLSASGASVQYIANAVQKFYKTHSVLSLPGSVPDMKGYSKDYISLQRLLLASS